MPNGHGQTPTNDDVNATFDALETEERLYDLIDDDDFRMEMNSAQTSLETVSRGLLDTPLGDRCRALLRDLSLLTAKMIERE